MPAYHINMLTNETNQDVQEYIINSIESWSSRTVSDCDRGALTNNYTKHVDYKMHNPARKFKKYCNCKKYLAKNVIGGNQWVYSNTYPGTASAQPMFTAVRFSKNPSPKNSGILYDMVAGYFNVTWYCKFKAVIAT